MFIRQYYSIEGGETMKKNAALKVARARLGLTQTQLAKKIGKTQSWVSWVEGDGLGDANLKDVLRLCKVLGLSITEITDGMTA